MNFYFAEFLEHINNTHLKQHRLEFSTILKQQLQTLTKHGDWDDWMQCLNQLPNIKANGVSLDQDCITIGQHNDAQSQQIDHLKTLLLELKPWRKGPFNLFDIFIDCEWRSDWKWQRLAPHISNLKDRYVLDVGCGSGYHSIRMQAAGASCVIGIDPAAKFFIQYLALKQYLQQHTSNLHFLPLTVEQMPNDMQAFDSVFSMGVLYHRRSPFDHLEQLKKLLKPGGELILETLIVEGAEHTVLVPNGRYACMRNVWFLPSQITLEGWLHRMGWKNIRCVDVNTTRIEEQRSTQWMDFRSLKDFLDPHNPHLNN